MILAVDPSLYFTAIGAGIVSFISPCNAALLPTFISYIGSAAKNRKQSLIMSVLYALGFSITFGVFGVLFLAGLMSLSNRRYFNFLAGIITIFLALYLLFSKYVDKGVRKIKNKVQNFQINKKFPNKINDADLQENYTPDSDVEKIDEKSKINRYGKYFGAFLLGLTTGSSWIACVTPVFGTIIAIASVQHDYAATLYLMILYGLGIMVPYIIIGLLLGEISSRFIMKMIKIGSKVEKFFAIVLIWIGIEIILSGFGIAGLLPFI